MTPILILAAGLSSRMRGRDKLAETVDGVPLLTRIAGAAVASGEPVHVALPALDHPRARLLDGLDVVRLVLPGSADGMGGTLRDGVKALPEAARLLVLLADLPLIGPDEIAAVLAAPSAAPHALIWRGAAADGTPGHPILFDGSLRPGFARLGGDDGAKAVVAAHRDRTHLVPLPGRAATLDLDTPEAWAAFRSGSAPET
ncbi:nucleotidyltransferase family protein [Wenxinia marina]|uniref:Putative MobA-related protein n=1 Tax=Wenxinia marina DSM 24838 TaxID=1123501 RepID=A0A0D0Q2I2_9RHOB|nr:NTP transferase domain-containing protein [Wenxinia marina]KIQ68729.1 putative MobA-related protein [Wenxinia marina DSM 24838]GGL65613.1 molybdopterin-guanine dinucleotide biosynthesis protein A [Wenxinia marina]